MGLIDMGSLFHLSGVRTHVKMFYSVYLKLWECHYIVKLIDYPHLILCHRRWYIYSYKKGCKMWFTFHFCLHTKNSWSTSSQRIEARYKFAYYYLGKIKMSQNRISTVCDFDAIFSQVTDGLLYSSFFPRGDQSRKRASEDSWWWSWSCNIATKDMPQNVTLCLWYLLSETGSLY